MKKTIILLTVLFSVLTVQSQVPGYMGKKTTAGYGIFFNPAFGNITQDYGDNPVNVLHTFFLERATGRKFSLGLSAQLYRYTYNNVDFIDVNNGHYSSTIDQVDDAPQGTYDIKGRNFSLYGKFFKAHYLAPWGKYFVLGLTLNRYETNYNPSVMRVRVQEQKYSSLTQSYVTTTRYISDFGYTTQSYQKVDILFGNGNSRIFGNNIVLDYGYNINVISMSSIFLTALDSYEYSSPDNYIEKTSKKRVSAINRFNFYVKLAYLF